MRPIYKKVKVIAEFCPVCLKQLRGDNSIIFPWRCDCGVWKVERGVDFGYSAIEYEIKPLTEKRG